VELAWREAYGINIAYIKRGEKLIYAPGRNNRLLPFDHVGIIATDDQMQTFRPVFDAIETVEKTNGLVVGIERAKERILNPDSTTDFEWGDIVWIVGERKKIHGLNLV